MPVNCPMQCLTLPRLLRQLPRASPLQPSQCEEPLQIPADVCSVQAWICVFAGAFRRHVWRGCRKLGRSRLSRWSMSSPSMLPAIPMHLFCRLLMTFPTILSFHQGACKRERSAMLTNSLSLSHPRLSVSVRLRLPCSVPVAFRPSGSPCVCVCLTVRPSVSLPPSLPALPDDCAPVSPPL